jgi:hypothetical protein
VKLVQKIHHGREIDTGGLLNRGHAQRNCQVGLDAPIYMPPSGGTFAA